MNLIQAIVALLIGLGGLWVAGTSLRRGDFISEDGRRIAKSEQPVRFRLEAAGWAVISFACLGFAIWKFSAQ